MTAQDEIIGLAMTDRNTTKGIVTMLIGIGLMTSMDASVKWLVEHSIHPVQLLFTRAVIIVPALIIYYHLKNNTVEIRPTRPVAQLTRGMLGSVAPLAFFIGVAFMPLSTAVVIFFSSIFMISMLSVVFLGEKVGRHRWIAILVGYVGVIVAMSPEEGGSIAGYFLILLSSFGYACLFVSGRHLSRTEPVPSLVLSYNLGTGLVMLFAMYWFWTIPTATEWLVILLMTAFAMAGHFCVTHAFSVSEASLLAPFELTTILWAILFDLLIWRELPGATTWYGALIIVFSVLYLIHREKKQRAYVRSDRTE